LEKKKGKKNYDHLVSRIFWRTFAEGPSDSGVGTLRCEKSPAAGYGGFFFFRSGKGVPKWVTVSL